MTDNEKKVTPSRSLTAWKVFFALFLIFVAPNIFSSFRIIVENSNLRPSSKTIFKTVNDDPMNHRRISPVCRPSFGTAQPGQQRIKRIFFGHMRKAGGSTLRSYLKAVAEKYSLIFVVNEATKFEIAGNRNDTLYVTQVRDPVARAISHFAYENRWPCHQLVYNQSVFVPTKENALRLETWIHTDNENGTCSRWNSKKGWKCAFNCYIRWLNFPQGFCDPQVLHSPLYQRALDRAFQYNLIVHSEMLFKDPRYVAKIERMFGMKGLAGLNRAMWCGKESKRANQMVPLRIENQTLNELYHLNTPDYTLFNQLVECPDGYQFPQQTLPEFVYRRLLQPETTQD
jgi:hypothetical protein